MKKLLTISLLFFLFSPAFAQTDEVAATGEAPAELVVNAISAEVVELDREYSIEEGDVLDIFVWHEEDLKRQVIVRPDGKISFPLVGEIKATGLNFSELKSVLAQKLKRFISRPVVSVSLVTLGGRKVIVLGEVKNPGVYSVSRKSNMLEAIANAGGFTRDAVKSSVILVRGNTANPTGVRLNLDRAINEQDLAQNLMVQAEDIIYVPETFISNASRFLTKLTDPIADALYIRNNIRDLGR